MKRKSRYPFHFSNVSEYDQVFKIIRSLYDIPRTGYKDRGVEDPETVGEHTDAVVILGRQLYPHITGLSKMLEIHDWAESDKRIGDARTDKYCPEGKRWSKEEKYETELAIMQEICSGLKQNGKEILSLWLEFEENKTKRARIAKQLDKLQMILKAIEYQKQGEPIIAKEFIDSSGKEIIFPKMKAVLKEAISNLSQLP